ncbi:MAG: PQQ-binding-like beta-propeller repeat protein, partial [Deltaproteobacteria bacterium]|nr:PQQ-binding-like beta-propeller repeat protein [Deltaproteobacteria bacterium]
MRLSRKIVPIVIALGLAGTGCASNTFSLSYPDNDLASLSKVLAKIRPQPLAPVNGAPMVFLVTRKKPTRIIAFDLNTKKVAWKIEGSVTSRIIVGRGRLYHTEKGQRLIARDAATGRKLWGVVLRRGARLLGVAADGDRVYYTAEAVSRLGGDGAAGYVVAVDAVRGKVLWERPSKGRLGAPAARDGFVFVPLRYQSVSILEPKKGEEIARVRSKDEAILWVRAAPSGIYFGGKTGIYRLDKKAVVGTRKGATFVSGALPVTVRPAYWWDGYNAALSGYTAFDRNRLLWRLAGQRFRNDGIYVHNYRFFFAFEGSPAKAGREATATLDRRGKQAKPSGSVLLKTSRAMPSRHGKDSLKGGAAEGATKKKGGDEKSAVLKWAYSFPRYDVVASYHTGNALVLVSVKGDVLVLDLDNGLPATRTALKVSMRGASFDAAGFASTVKPKGRANLQRALTEMIWDPDRRFGEVKLFGIQQLSALSGAHVAKALVQIVTRPGIDAKVYKRAGEMIVARHDRSAIPLYLKVLKSHYIFVDGATSHAVDIMARALGDLRAPEAVQPLLRHLVDHETPQKALVPIARALMVIGDKAAVEPLRDFLLTYRCEPLFKKTPEALNVVGDALLTLGGEEERQLLSFVANDAHSVKSLRVYLKAALRQHKVASGARKVKGKVKG